MRLQQRSSIQRPIKMLLLPPQSQLLLLLAHDVSYSDTRLTDR